MKVIRGIHNLNRQISQCVATIGNFDGVHRGHQYVISQLNIKARELKVPSVVVIFEPQPMEFFAATKAPARLTRLREKIQALEKCEVDYVLCVHFTRRFAALGYQEFISKVLIDGLGIRHLVVGDDFRFGKDREGTFQHLKDAGKNAGFDVVSMDTFALDGERVSSTRVREALEQAEFERVRHLLDRLYSMSGHVAHGEKLGRELGYPTANIHIRRRVSPLNGIYIVEVGGLGKQLLPAVASIGTRPTVDGKQVILEVHIFNFDESIYGRCVDIYFLKKIRDELKFDSLDALKVKIAEDVEIAKAYFNI